MTDQAPPDPRPPDAERSRSAAAAADDASLREDDFARGLKNRRAVLGDAWVDKSLGNANAFNADFQSLITRYAWGEIWAREGLDRRTRSCITLAVLAALGREHERGAKPEHAFRR